MRSGGGSPPYWGQTEGSWQGRFHPGRCVRRRSQRAFPRSVRRHSCSLSASFTVEESTRRLRPYSAISGRSREATRGRAHCAFETRRSARSVLLDRHRSTSVKVPSTPTRSPLTALMGSSNYRRLDSSIGHAPTAARRSPRPYIDKSLELPSRTIERSTRRAYTDGDRATRPTSIGRSNFGNHVRRALSAY